jgi:Tfp pilus assembly protein PilN
MTHYPLSLPMVGDRVDLRPASMRPAVPRWGRTAVFLVLLGGMILAATADLRAYAAYELAVANRPVVVRAEAQIAALDRRLAGMRQQAAAAGAVRAALAALGPNAYPTLAALLQAAPQGVSLQNVAVSSTEVTLAGQARSVGAVSAYALALAGLAGVSDPSVTSVAEGGGGYTFSITVARTGGAGGGA